MIVMKLENGRRIGVRGSMLTGMVEAPGGTVVYLATGESAVTTHGFDNVLTALRQSQDKDTTVFVEPDPPADEKRAPKSDK